MKFGDLLSTCDLKSDEFELTIPKTHDSIVSPLTNSIITRDLQMERRKTEQAISTLTYNLERFNFWLAFERKDRLLSTGVFRNGQC